MNTQIERIDDNHLCELMNSEWFNDPNTVIIDIRTPAEFAREHIEGSHNIPVDQLDDIDAEKYKDKTLVFHCRSGARTQQVIDKLAAIPCKQSLCLQGGIEQWKRCNYPVKVNRNAPIDIMRQVQIAAGSLIVLGVLLTVFISSYFIIIPAFVGLGLLFAGLTGFCGMANLLMLLPYNKVN